MRMLALIAVLLAPSAQAFTGEVAYDKPLNDYDIAVRSLAVAIVVVHKTKCDTPPPQAALDMAEKINRTISDEQFRIAYARQIDRFFQAGKEKWCSVSTRHMQEMPQ